MLRLINVEFTIWRRICYGFWEPEARMSKQVLIVEDEPILSRNLSCGLQSAPSIAEAKRTLVDEARNLICLDVRLMYGNGLEFKAGLRETRSDLSAAVMIGEGCVARPWREAAGTGGQLRAPHERRAVFHTVLHRYRDAPPMLAVRALPANEEDGAPTLFDAQATEVVAERRDGTRVADLVFIAPGDGQPRRFSVLRFNGAWTWLRPDADGALSSAQTSSGARRGRDPETAPS